MALPDCVVRIALRLPALICLASICAAGSAVYAADATSPVDATDRNTPYAPAATVVPDKKLPAATPDSRVQERRFDTTKVDRKDSPLGEKRAGIEMNEAHEKNVREKDSHRPERVEQPLSSYNHRQATVSTGADTTKPPTVTKYQDSLTSASATNMARFPAFGRATSAKINRFVFRKNPPESDGALNGAAVTPAAGGSAIGK